MSRAAPIFSVSSIHCFSVRTSHQMSAGRTGSPAASSVTAPCICPEKPTHAILSLETFAWASALRTAIPQARHQSRGSCSAHPIGCEAKFLAKAKNRFEVPETDCNKSLIVYVNGDGIVSRIHWLARRKHAQFRQDVVGSGDWFVDGLRDDAGIE